MEESNPLGMVSFTLRVPRFFKSILAKEVKRRKVEHLDADASEASLCREALREWSEKRELLPKGVVAE